MTHERDRDALDLRATIARIDRDLAGNARLRRQAGTDLLKVAVAVALVNAVIIPLIERL